MEMPDIKSGYFKSLLDWADTFSRLLVRANADVPIDAKTAIEFGAQGIGLCRTEHMFFKKDRIFKMRQMILTQDKEEQKKYLAVLEEYQKGDFKQLFTVMAGKPVTIRMLDPPLHEFLPTEEEDIKELSQEMKIPLKQIH